MILVFLGSWRSTLIITISIPLAILASVAALSAIGETINVMTLGGLALAVGILVDDATVTIENINWHLEQGKDIEIGDHGRRAPDRPSRDRLAAVHLHRVRADVQSRRRRRLSLPPDGRSGRVRARRLLRPVAHAGARRWRAICSPIKRIHGARRSRGRRRAIRWCCFQRGFERRFEATRAVLSAPAGDGARRARRLHRRLSASPSLLVRACPVSRTELLSRRSTARRSSFTCARRPGRASRRRRCSATGRGAPSARSIPPEALGPIVDNIGLPVSGINSTYNNSGTVGPADADILITLNPAYRERRGRLRDKHCARPCRNRFPGTTFAFLPADIVSQILNFGLPAPIDVQVVGANFDANRAYADELLKRIARVPGVADARIQQASNNPTFGVDVDRMRAAQVGLNEGDVAKSLQETPFRQFQGRADVLDQSEERRRLSDRRADAAILAQFGLVAGKHPGVGSSDASQILGGLATLKREVSPAVVSHYAVQPVIDIYARQPASATSARFPPTSRRILDETGERRAARLERRDARTDRRR